MGTAAQDRAERAANLIVRRVLEAVTPGRMVDRAWDDVADRLGTGRDSSVDILSIGKASVGMAEAAIERLGSCAGRGFVLVPAGRETEIASLVRRCPTVEWFVVDHPLPTARNVAAAEAVERFLAGSPAGLDARSLLVLISGGGSAQLTLPARGLTLDNIAGVSAALMRAGADICELNTVRKHLERLKGGRAARVVLEGRKGSEPLSVVTLVVSDVIGDHLSVIASGPFAPDPTTCADAIEVLKHRGVFRGGAPAVWDHLERGVRGTLEETPKPGDAAFVQVEHRVIGRNADAVLAATKAVEELGVQITAQRLGITGEASERARAMVAAIVSGVPHGQQGAVVWGGETTVTVGEGRGLGGRNQEFVLAAAEAMSTSDVPPGLMVMSLGTDGIDGSTDAAGAYATGEMWGRLVSEGIDPGAALRDHDSHRVLDRAGGLIRTGPTGTNVNDVMVAIDWADERARRGDR